MKRVKVFLLCFGLCCVLVMVSCASFNKSHTSHFSQQNQLVQQGRAEDVAQKLEIKAKNGGRNRVLHALEAGYYYLFIQDYDRSKELFEIAEDHIEEYEERAKVNARDVAAGAKSAVTSDMELPYKGEMFEKVMLNTMLALNYLFQGDIEGANVEVRRAEIRQKEAENKHQKELKKIEKQKKEKKLDDRSLDSIYKNYNVLDDFAAQVINSFQNGFTYFLGGLIFELNNRVDDAYKDYYKSFSLYKNRYTLEKLIELSQIMRNKSQFDKWANMYKDLFNKDVTAYQGGNNGDAELVVVYFSGNVPQKTQAKFSLWLPKKSFNVALPFYDRNTFFYGKDFLEINQNGETIGKTEMVLNFVPIVVKALKEKLPGIAIRQILRLVAKNEVENAAEKKGGLWGKLAAKVFNTVTERADLRGWYELPSNIQIFRSKIEPGLSTFALKEISDLGEMTIKNIDLDIPDNGTAFLLVHQLSTKRVTHSIVLNQRRIALSNR